MANRVKKDTLTIMVVEDDPTTEQSLIDCLSDLGNVITFSNAENALSFIERGGRIDLVISDIVLGQMNGIEFCESLNQTFSGDKFVPVIFYSAFADSAMERLAYDAGGVDFIEKPMSFARLQLRVRAFLDISRRFSHLRRRLDIDPLTGLMLSSAFLKLSGVEVLKRMFTGSTSAIILINIRALRELNESGGIKAGDQLIKDVAQALQEIATSDGLIVSRHIGGEFLVMVPECNAGSASISCSDLLEKLQAKLESRPVSSPLPIFYGAGASLTYSADLHIDRLGSVSTISKMIDVAVEQMHNAKSNEKGGWDFVDLTNEIVNNA